MSLETKDFYDFGDFRLDLTEKVLLRDGKFISITPKVFETLQVMVENAGRLIEKDELMERIWHERFVEESNLTFNIKMLRKALGDDAAKPRFIETVPKRGYRFIAEVRRVETKDEELEIKDETAAPQLNHSYDSPAKFPHPVNRSETKISGAVVALADSRREAVENEPEESAPEIAPEKSNGKIAKLELVPTNPVIESLPTAKTQNSFSQRIKTHKISSAVAVALLLVGAIAISFYFIRRFQTAIEFQAGQITRLTSSGRVKAATISPDGKFTIYAQEENNDQQSLWLQHLGSESSVQIAPPANIDFRSLNISPDSNSLYYHDATGTLYRMAVLGGKPKKVADNLFSRKVFGNEKIGISPDGKQIAFVRRFEDSASKLFTADADGANERILASFEQPNILLQVSAWSPDGKIISCILANKGVASILAVRVADGTSAPVVVQESMANILNFSWMPDSKSLIAQADVNRDDYYQIWQIAYPGGEARQITNDINEYYKINATSDGGFLTAVRTVQTAEIWMMSGSDVSRVRQLTAGFEKYDGTFLVGWMPDGKIIYDSAASRKLSGWTIEADGSNPQQLIKGGVLHAVSPDGRYLVYQTYEGLWRTDLKDGSEKQLTKGSDTWATFSPDGKWIVYTGYHERITISRVSVDGGEPQIIYDGGIVGLNPKVSPDGKTVAFTVSGKINLVPFAGGEIIKTFDTKPESIENINKQNLQWTPDGLGIYFIALNNGVSNIWRQPIDGSPPVQITKFETGRIFNFAYSSDGKQLVLSRGSLNSDVVLIKNSE